ncbi:succinylglutamate desuccinylase/aspartoacylase family protein [Gilvimarinus agarilyticus]|uniref:succinylglutamate desuccinylase/aspartoacylase family protein n=1 Tax=unclassified Gilvimarinus TaxID=2642066 RepID=UPI001C0978D8|nr:MULTISPECIES: succinylglutamate desuccinylase/aspartoacylase family protein [unclassified Gilvimarinus]MBU2887601.1 succinylglutamate desuccinylase/aspartoacylase family protein [Gilvimarinus agarilyticus]MDO6572252.1 M14 family metallopeptidase [Gilvimarinus sp. 2_MG-2023]MDO6746819.1 M14 family metallopeptidase [Gilvimarinus sp. 1_MG-2023]
MNEKNTPIVIGGETIAPGETRSVDIPLAAMYTHTDVGLTVHVIHGKRPGPCLLVTAAVHGDEINGVDIIRRVLGIKQLNKLRGTLLAIPVVNVHGFLNQSRYLPDGRDLNRCFPGSQRGSLAGRVAHTLVTDILQHCTHCIDLHTGARHRANLPQIRVDLSLEENRDLGLAFGSPVVLDAKLREGSLRETAAQQGIPLLLYEAGEALRFDEFSIRAGTRGIINVMRHLNMLPKKRRIGKETKVTIADDSRWVRAPMSGVMRPLVQLGAKVEKGTTLAYVSDPIGMTQIPVIAPAESIVIGLTNLPLVHEGEALFHLANYSKQIHQVADQVVDFHETFDPSQDEDEPFFIGEDESLLN